MTIQKFGLAATAILAAASVTAGVCERRASAADEIADRAVSKPAVYRGWNTQCLSNNLVTVHVVPQIGGRVIQFQLGDSEFFWVNPELAGKLAPPSGLAPNGEWLNYGGDKLWPAPQGWNNAEQWPGPPDAVLDGQPYELEKLPAAAGAAAVRLTSGEDRRSGIQFSRVIRLYPDSTRVDVQASMKNIDTRPRRWGIWAHTQLDATSLDPGKPNLRMRAWCPVNPRSRFPEGYQVIFGTKDNPSFRADSQQGLIAVNYRYQVGKIGVDSHAGWVATVDGTTGAAFVQVFTFEPDREYPDQASVEFWHNGIGNIRAYNRDMEMADDPAKNPFVFESELLSPYFELQPGESCTWQYGWRATNIGGDHPVLACTQAGVVAEPLTIVRSERKPPAPVKLTGRFGVFAPGKLRLVFLDRQGSALGQLNLTEDASPLKAVVLDTSVEYPAGTAAVEVMLVGKGSQPPLRLARASTGR